MKRYAAYTLDGSVIYQADTAQAIGDIIFQHMKEDRKPQIAYSFDHTKPAFPFTVYNLEWNSCIGTQCKDFDEVLKLVRKHNG